ncbi:hypothetical protein PQR66_09960 [Paraburkholderia agricolaris]|uniref:TrbM protein n=1 Tax=Paraburkholderia agricolaris TaxID=2152888 RepID=A0ABW8ZMP8_9BURK
MALIRKISLVLTCTMIGSLASVATVASAQGSPGDQYASMCISQGVTAPAPYGESDLKGNPKLQDYCKCFGDKFAERAMKGAPDTSSPASLKQTVNEEREMRNSCRKKYGLPQLKFRS